MAVVHEVKQGQFGIKLGPLKIAGLHLNFTINPKNNNVIMWCGYEFAPTQSSAGPILPSSDPCAVFTLGTDQYRTGYQPNLTIDYDHDNQLITLASDGQELNMTTGGDKGEHGITLFIQ